MLAYRVRGKKNNQRKTINTKQRKVDKISISSLSGRNVGGLNGGRRGAVDDTVMTDEVLLFSKVGRIGCSCSCNDDNWKCCFINAVVIRTLGERMVRMPFLDRDLE